MAAPMPPVLVIIACKTILMGPPDANAAYTHWENRDWAYENSMMVCRREEIALYDPAVDGGQDSNGHPVTPADPIPFTPAQCQRSGPMLFTAWDQDHKNTPYRAWKFSCPTPVFNSGADGIPHNGDDEIVDWQIPPCPESYGTVKCEKDSVI